MKKVKKQSKKAMPELTARELRRLVRTAHMADEELFLAEERLRLTKSEHVDAEEAYRDAEIAEEYYRRKADKCWFNTRKFVALRLEADKECSEAYTRAAKTLSAVRDAEKALIEARTISKRAHDEIPEEFYDWIKWNI